MKIEDFITIYRKGGFRINKIAGHYFLHRTWMNYSFPQLIDIHLNDTLINSLKWRHPLTVIKTECRIKNAYEFILETSDYSIDKFAIKKRNNIRKSQKDCSFKHPSLEDLQSFGLRINQQTLKRQERSDKYLCDCKCWKKCITSLYNQPDISILGAYISDRMVGYLIIGKINENYYITHPYFDKDASSSSPMPGLIFSMVNQLIARDGKIRISYGFDSFNPLPDLVKYKLSMLFHRVPTTRVYVINPILLFFLKMVLFYHFGILKQKNSTNRIVRKIVSLVQGSRILVKLKNPPLEKVNRKSHLQRSKLSFLSAHHDKAKTTEFLKLHL